MNSLMFAIDVVVDLATSIGAARRSARPDRETARRAAVRDVCRGARAALHLPATVSLTRPGQDVPTGLDELELQVLILVVELAAAARDTGERRAREILCDIVALESSPALGRS